MKLCTYVDSQNEEKVGIIISHPGDGRDWVFDPERAEALFDSYAAAPTSPYSGVQPHFLANRPWPKDMVEFLNRSGETIPAAKNLAGFLTDFLQRGDQVLLNIAGAPVGEVKLSAPVPRPRFLFGIVSNSATFFRNKIERTMFNIIPQGHARPIGSVIGPNDPLVVPPGLNFGWNPELGVVISKAGRNIPVEKARDHIAGLTVILDISNTYYHQQFDNLASESRDFFAAATASWVGKCADTFCAMGPYITTLDEVGNMYDLLLYTRQSGMTRDRSHTNSMLIGVERLVHYMSTIKTLLPGDVLHLATMGVDGMKMIPEMSFSADDFIEGEIERVGTLRCPVVHMDSGDWRDDENPGRSVHVSPAVRRLIKARKDNSESAEAWRLKDAAHFWTCYGNYVTVSEHEKMDRCKLPRVLCGPASALAPPESVVAVPARADHLLISAEMCFVVRKAARSVSVKEAADYILGYAPLAACIDPSLEYPIAEPATIQERAIPSVYGRWLDGFNVMGPLIPAEDAGGFGGQSIVLEGSGISGEYSLDDYDHNPEEVLSFLSGLVTLFPGDVITLGRLGGLRKLSPIKGEWSGEKITVSIGNLGTAACTLTQISDDYLY